MKNKLIVFLLLVLVAAVAADAAVIKVKVATANVRAKPDLMAPVVTRAAQGALFEVQGKTGSWFEISVVDNAGNIVTGYINADVVEEIGGGAPAQPAPRTSQPTPQPQPAAIQTGGSGYAAPAGAGGFVISAGVAMTNISFDTDTQKALDDGKVSKKMRFGFQFGVSYELPLAQNISIVPGMYFSTMGTKLSATVNNATVTDSMSFSTIIIPIDIKFSFGGPFLSAGPYFGYILSGKYIPQEGEETDLYKADEEGIVYYTRIHFGFQIGAGFEANMGNMGLFAKLGYQLGLSNILKITDTADKASYKHNAILFVFGVKI